MKDSVIKIEALSTGFRQKNRQKLVLHERLDLQLNTGELVCILGPNGAGKSTLLRTLLGFEKALKGSIYINGIALDDISVKDLSKLISVVLTDKIEDMFLTTFEIVSTGRYPYGNFSGKLTQDDIDVVELALTRVGIKHLSGKVFTRLSDGEKQKVMIAKAIAQDTPFVFLDEPVAFVDAPSKIGIMQLLHEMVENSGKGVLMATHDLDAALNYADRIWLMGINGKWEEGRPNDLLNKDRISEFFDQENIKFDSENKRFKWVNK